MASKVEFGKSFVVGLSALFVPFTMWYIFSGRAAVAEESERRTFYLMAILLGGPLIYYFVATAQQTVTLSTPLGKIVLSGCYAVAISAVLFVEYLPARHAWRCLTIKNGGMLKHVEPIEQKPPGSVFRVAQAEGQLHKFICYFPAEVGRVLVEFMVDDGHISRPCEVTIARAGTTFSDLDLLEACKEQ